MATENAPIAPLSLPLVPSEAELRMKIMNLQKQMGIPTEDDYDPLRPGGNEDELYPSQPGEFFFDFRLA